jgi:hypothetical protein
MATALVLIATYNVSETWEITDSMQVTRSGEI